MSMTIKSVRQIQVAIAWCLVYAPNSPNNPETLATLRQHFYHDQPCGDHLAAMVAAVRSLSDLTHPETVPDLQQIITNHPILWQTKVGLVYGGATKIKPYVFDVPKLHEIRGASALLDNINLVDLPAFFHADQSNEERFKACRNADTNYCESVRTWLAAAGYRELAGALIEELIIYSTGGNILTFCPPDLVDLLADAIEKRYTTETLIANSCAVGKRYKPLEIQLGLLPDQVPDDFVWLEQYQRSSSDELVQAYLKIKHKATPEEITTAFHNRKSFNEITSQLAILFNQRRAGNDGSGRSSRRYPVMVETHPYLRRDNAEKRSAVLQANGLPDSPWYSEPSARKRIIGQIAKREQRPQFQPWYDSLKSRWHPNPKAESWVKRFEDYLKRNDNADLRSLYYGQTPPPKIFEAQTVGEIGNASNPDKYIGYIYADGNNMGGYIQGITTPQEYRQFSEDISRITEESVYAALAEHLTIHQLQDLTDPERYHDNGDWVHPFEIITVGGDDVFLIVPADQALQIAQAIGEGFERRLSKKPEYHITSNSQTASIHRYQPVSAHPSISQLSMSTGVLITAEATPILYAQNLTGQLLKSAKETAKRLKRQGYHGGTIDFLVLKSVTMISSDINEFRKDGLVKKYSYKKTHQGETPKDLHLYAAPYTLHEIGGLIQLIQALKAVDFPKSQLYQIRSFLEKGKRTAILNYRYFRVRLKDELQKPLWESLEGHWCPAKENNGNIAPWMYYSEPPNPDQPEGDGNPPKPYYETIWRELVDLYEFMPELSTANSNKQAVMRQTAEVGQ